MRNEGDSVKYNEQVLLGKTGLKVGRLGIASGYGAPVAAIEEAFDHGCNYMTWGTFMKGYAPGMREAIRNIAAKGRREQMVLAMFSYAHQSLLTEHYLLKGLKSAGVDYADILILGFYSWRPSPRTIESALRLKEKGLIRVMGLSGHNRKLFPRLHQEGVFDVFHLRYNAVHRGAETEAFPFLTGQVRPGVVNFTATAWGKLLNPKKIPTGERPPTAAECYRFVLSNPAVDVCMTGARTVEQMRENLAVLEQGPMTDEELARMRRIGDHIYGRR
jgi:predicted aldo/keto reductase-like oxidoreductase